MIFTKRIIIFISLLFFVLITLFFRFLPALGSADIVIKLISDDPPYNIRLVELFLSNHFQYSWYDPFSGIPNGVMIYWGPITTLVGGFVCALLGGSIISDCLLVTPIIASLIVVLVYFLGKVYGDWKTGLITSGMCAIVSGTFFFYSIYGYFNHRIFEVFFSTLFCLFYIYTISERNVQRAVALSVLTGVAYLLGLFTMPTMILFAALVGAFTLLQFILDFYHGNESSYLVIVNGIVFSIASCGLWMFGFKTSTVDLSMYSVAHVYAYVALIVFTIGLYILSRIFKGKNKIYYLATIVGIGLIGIVMASGFIIRDFNAFFLQSAVSQTTADAMGLTLMGAIMTFNTGLILMFGGILIVLFRAIRNGWQPTETFLLLWAGLIIFSTWQHVRYEYYFIVILSLLSSIFVCFIWERRNDINKYIVLILIIIFALTSISNNYLIATSGSGQLDPDWHSTLNWVENNTPDTGINYIAEYNKLEFIYPNSSYGIMSWWDYGHEITLIKRIPVCNPFQDGVAGSNGCAAFLTSTNETVANSIMKSNRAKYVITDSSMVEEKFYAIETWANVSVKKEDTMMWKLQVENGSDLRNYKFVYGTENEKVKVFEHITN
jgi:dolichyl-phosphooligosaccharide-protein glycotransferase